METDKIIKEFFLIFIVWIRDMHKGAKSTNINIPDSISNIKPMDSEDKIKANRAWFLSFINPSIIKGKGYMNMKPEK